MEKFRVPGVTGVDLSLSDIDSAPNKLLYSQNFILTQKYGNLRKRPGSIEYPITGDIYGLGGYSKSSLSFTVPISEVPVRHRYSSSTSYFEKKDWALEADEVNFYTYSEQLNNAAWNKQNVTVTANSVVAPDGNTTADTLTASVGTSTHYFYPTVSPAGLASGNTERHSVYIKKGNHPYVSVSNAYADALVYDFDAMTSKTCYAAGGFTSYSVEGVENDWYRFTIEFVKTDSSTRQIYVAMRGSYSSSATGVGAAWASAGTETVYVWGMQANDYTDSRNYVATTVAAIETPVWEAITIDADAVATGVAGISRMAQIDTVLGIFAGLPVMIDDIDTGTVKRLGGDAPASAPTIAASAGAGLLTGTYSVCYTFYDSISGWESSPSPISNEITITSKNIEWTGIATTSAKTGVDYVRLYRTESSGEQTFYLAFERLIGTSTFTDSISPLTTQAPDIGDHDAPPGGSYLGEAYANRFWTTDGTNSLRFSKVYDGNINNLQYFPAVNEIFFNQKITGIRASERLGGLLVFCPPGFGISLIRGTSEDNFEVISLYDTEGTSYDSSITVVGDDVVYWGSGHPELIKNGVISKLYSKPLQDKLKELSMEDYNMSSYVWSFWHPYYHQIFWGVSAYSSTGSSWSELSSAIGVEWEELTSGLPVAWGDL